MCVCVCVCVCVALSGRNITNTLNRKYSHGHLSAVLGEKEEMMYLKLEDVSTVKGNFIGYSCIVVIIFQLSSKFRAQKRKGRDGQ